MFSLKGQCHEIFCFWFFSWISFPQASDHTIRAVSNFFKNSRRYSQLMVCHQCQRHNGNWWQYLPPVSLIPEANLPPVSLIPVAICHRCQQHRWCTLTCEYLREVLKKIRKDPNVIFWGLGEDDSWKKPEAKNLVTLSLNINISNISQKTSYATCFFILKYKCLI